MHSKYGIAVSVLLAALFINGCMSNLSPREVSDGFWQGVKNRDAAMISRFVTAASQEALKQQDPAANVLPVKEVTLGRIVIDGGRAWIETTVEIADDKPLHMSLQTVLLQENQEWKVDYDSTVATIRHDSNVGRVLDELGALAGRLADKLNLSLEEAQKALPEIEREIGKIESELSQKLPELRQRLEELLRQMEEALGNRNRPDSTPPPRTREI